jgi:hypothetical protein
VLKLSDKAKKKIRFVERWHVCSENWAASWEKSRCSIALNSIHPEHDRFVLNGDLGTT